MSAASTAEALNATGRAMRLLEARGEYLRGRIDVAEFERRLDQEYRLGAYAPRPAARYVVIEETHRMTREQLEAAAELSRRIEARRALQVIPPVGGQVPAIATSTSSSAIPAAGHDVAMAISREREE